MGLTLAQQLANIQINLGNNSFYTIIEIANSIQDAYNEIAALVLYNVKSVTLPWPSQLNWFDFVGNPALNVTDYLGTIAIFNNSTNQFLRDDVQIRDYDRLRRDWEWWSGTPQFWAAHSVQWIAIAPSYPANTVGLTFTLYYYAQSPNLISNLDDIDTTQGFLIASDMDDLIEFYVTADLLETMEEPKKATAWWKKYLDRIVQYKERSHNLAKYELLMRV
jgi:hypothetical protein